MSHPKEPEERGCKAPGERWLPLPAEDTEDWFPLSPLGTEGCQWDEYYPHLEDDEGPEKS
mgnify:CR=1 FL=1